jgi:hypothetical protein
MILSSTKKSDGVDLKTLVLLVQTIRMIHANNLLTVLTRFMPNRCTNKYLTISITGNRSVVTIMY